MSGQRVILIIAIGVLTIALVTLALYFLTRQVDNDTSPSHDGLQQAPAALTLPAPMPQPSRLGSYRALPVTSREDTIAPTSEAPPAPRRHDDLAG